MRARRAIALGALLAFVLPTLAFAQSSPASPAPKSPAAKSAVSQSVVSKSAGETGAAPLTPEDTPKIAVEQAPEMPEEQKGESIVDAVAVRFFAPETGGAARPRFITQRELAFEGRITARLDGEEDEALDDRHYRSALERRVAEQILAEIPGERNLTNADVTRVARELEKVLATRLGGAEALAALTRSEGIAPSEVQAMMERRARAAYYVDRALAPLLNPSESQLRDLHRLGKHPFKSAKFEDVRRDLRWWLIDERLRLAELSFLQSARTRVTMVYVPAD